MTIVRTDATPFAAALPRTEVAVTSPAAGSSEFAGRVLELAAEANDAQLRAAEASRAYATGERNDLHGTMIALEQADITLRFATNVRNRLVEAYREVMRMGA